MTSHNHHTRRTFSRGMLAGAAGLLAYSRGFAQETTPGSDESEIAPQLPVADLPDMNATGYLFNFESSWAGSYDNVPTEAPVIRMDWPTYDPDSVKDLAGKLGIEGDVSDQGDGAFEVSSDSGDMFVNPGLVQYISKADAAEGDLPADDQALAYAREWLRQTSLLPADANNGRIESRIDTPPRVVVSVMPVRPGKLISAYPSISVTLGPSGQVQEAAFRWPNLTAEEVYALRPAPEAWMDIENQLIGVSVDLPSDFADPGATVAGKATFTKAEVAYTTSGNPGQTQYLQPVYVFMGSVRPDGADKDYTATAYVPALVNSQQPVG